jgi:hypothetical protein
MTGIAARPPPQFGTRVPNSAGSVRAALLTATVTTQDAKSEPRERSYQRHHEAQQPERPSKAPEQKVELDVISVLDHEDHQQPHSGERRDRSPREPTRACGLPRTPIDHECSPRLVTILPSTDCPVWKDPAVYSRTEHRHRQRGTRSGERQPSANRRWRRRWGISSLSVGSV